MTKRRLGGLRERLTKVAMPDPAHGPNRAPDPVVLAALRTLRGRLPQLTGSLVASSDGLLIAHDLPTVIEPDGMAALAASELSLSQRMVSIANDGAFREVVVQSTKGYAVIYAAGPTASLTVLAGPGANVGRLHLESRPVARHIADHLVDAASGPQRPALP
ncbi:roadblock/LC7 domain-containing protein [Actinoallomurus vinaceus]